jgi:hypothetical protein
MPQNFLYRYARNKFLTSQIDWSTHTFKVMPLAMTGASGLGGSNTGAGYGTVTSTFTLGNSLSSGSGNGVAAGIQITSLADVPRLHRTYYRAAFGGTLTEANFNAATGTFGAVGIAHSQGGTANTYSLTGISVTYGDGVAAASDLTFNQVGSGTTIGSFILYRSISDVDLENTLVAFFDIATSMPVNTNGGDITIVWDTTANRIFKL